MHLNPRTETGFSYHYTLLQPTNYRDCNIICNHSRPIKPTKEKLHKFIEAKVNPNESSQDNRSQLQARYSDKAIKHKENIEKIKKTMWYSQQENRYQKKTIKIFSRQTKRQFIKEQRYYAAQTNRSSPVLFNSWEIKLNTNICQNWGTHTALTSKLSDT